MLPLISFSFLILACYGQSCSKIGTVSYTLRRTIIPTLGIADACCCSDLIGYPACDNFRDYRIGKKQVNAVGTNSSNWLNLQSSGGCVVTSTVFTRTEETIGIDGTTRYYNYNVCTRVCSIINWSASDCPAPVGKREFSREDDEFMLQTGYPPPPPPDPSPPDPSPLPVFPEDPETANFNSTREDFNITPEDLLDHLLVQKCNGQYWFGFQCVVHWVLNITQVLDRVTDEVLPNFFPISWTEITDISNRYMVNGVYWYDEWTTRSPPNETGPNPWKSITLENYLTATIPSAQGYET